MASSEYSKQYMRDFRKTEEGKKYWKEYYYNYRRTPKGWATFTLCSLRNKCKKNNIPFNLTQEDLIPPDTCPVLGIPIYLMSPDRDSCPSTDRIIPELGYIKGNVKVISGRANRLKSDATNAELLAILRYTGGLQ